MIIKTGGISAGDGPRITAYVTGQGDNERVEVLRDDSEQLLVADQFAQLKARKNGLLHIIISPEQSLTNDELVATLEAIRAEFGFNLNDPQTLSLHQSRRADGSTQQHYHLIRPAADTHTGRTYRLYRSKGKDESVGRLMELRLGHTLTGGANNQFVQMRLREQGHDDLADRLAAELHGERPRAAYSCYEHQQAKRLGFDLPALRQSLTEITALPDDQQPQALAELINKNGLELQDAIETGRGRSRIMIKMPAGIKNHNANRTLKVKAAGCATFIQQTQEIIHATRTYTGERRNTVTGSTNEHYQRPGADTQQQSRDDQTPEHTTQNHAGDQQELIQAASELRPQAAQFARNHAGDLTSADIDVAPDLRDPNLMRKLAAMLRRSLVSASDVSKPNFMK